MGLEGEDALRLEAQGVLHKYGAKVLIGSKWQPRYVKCQRDVVEIHHYKGVPPARGAVPSRMVDLQEIDRMVARPDALTIELFQRRDGARAVLLRAESVAELEFWARVFRAKVEYLKARAEQQEEGAGELQLRFATNTGTMLALMDDDEIEELAATAVEEAFSDGGAAADTHAAAAAAAVPDQAWSPRAAESSDEEAAPSWAAGGDSPIRARASDASDDVSGRCSSKAGGMRWTMERAVAGVDKCLRAMEGLLSDLEAELCAVACAGDKTDDEARKVALIDRLFASYYGHIEDRLVLEVATATPLGAREQDAVGAGRVGDQDQDFAGSLMAALACWRRVRRYEARLQAVQLPVEEGLLRSTRSRLEGGCALTSVLVPERALVGCVVSLAVREVEGAWSREAQGLERYYACSTGSGSDAATGTEEVPSPRRFTVLGTRRRPLSGTAESLPLAPSPCFSSAIVALERLLAGVEPWCLLEEEEKEEGCADRSEAQQQAAFLRGKAFMSAMLLLSGQVAGLPLQVRTEADTGVVLAVLEDLRRCDGLVATVQQRFFFSADGSGAEGEGSAMGEVAGVFTQAVERKSASAGALLLDYALTEDAQLQRLLGMVFVHPSWRRGEVTPLVVECFRRVLEGPLLARLPPALAERVEARLLRTFLVLYLRQLLRLPVHARSFEAEDALAFLMDETAVREWVEFRGRWASRPQRLEDLWVLRRIRIWLLMPAGEALDQFAEAWLEEGQGHPTLGPHLYDLLRFCLLRRRDVDAAAARAALLAVAEFVAQVGAATGRMAASPAPLPSPAKILLELFPRAGTQHITGEAWRWEAPAGKEEREALAVAVGPVVLKTCDKLRAPKPKRLGGGASPERMPVLQLPVLVPAPGAAASSEEGGAGAAEGAGEKEEEEEEEDDEEEEADGRAVKETAVVEPLQIPEPIVPVVTVSPRAAAHAAMDTHTPAPPAPQQPDSPSASSAASSANPFEDEDEDEEEEGGGKQAAAAAAAPSPVGQPPPSPHSPSQQQGTGKRVFGGGMFFRPGSSSPPVSPRLPQQQPAPPSPISSSRTSGWQQRQQGRIAATVPVAAAPVPNPFGYNEEDEEEVTAIAAPPLLPPAQQQQQQRRVFGGGIAAAVSTASPRRIATATAPPAPLPPPRAPEAAAPRRFAGGLWDSGGESSAQGGMAPPQALAAKAPAPAPAPRRPPTPPPASRPQPQKPQPQETGRRSFGGQGTGWW